MCGGKTILICDSCDGSGSVTDIAEICIQTTPKYNITYPSNTSEQVKSIIQSNMVANIKNIANATRLDIKVDDGAKKVIENYKIQVPFATFHLTFNDKRFEYTIYGKNLQIEKWHDDIVPTILANDVKILARLAKESSFFNTKILAKSQVAVANFMESQINQNIIKADSQVDNERYKKIDDRVNQIQNSIKSKIVSDNYIKWAIKSLHKMASRFCLAVRLKYFSIAFATSFVFMFCSGYGMFIKTIIVLVIFVCVVFIIQYIEQSNIKKIWGEDLANWAHKKNILAVTIQKENNKDKAEFNNKQYIALFWTSLIAVFVVAYLMNYYVISFDEIKSKITNLTQSSKITQTQTTQSKQTQPAKPTQSSQSAQNILRCDNKDLLKHIVKIDKNFLVDVFVQDVELFVKMQEDYRQAGINVTNAEELVNSLKYKIINVRTKSSDVANREIVCEVGLETINSIHKATITYNIVK